jgi:hypothetical protein
MRQLYIASKLAILHTKILYINTLPTLGGHQDARTTVTIQVGMNPTPTTTLLYVRRERES